MKKLFAIFVLLLSVVSVLFADMKIWHPYVPMKQAFDVDMDFVNEPVLYYTDKPLKDGYYYVGIYEGLTKSASLARYENKKDAYRMFNLIMQLAYKTMEFYPVDAEKLAKKFGTTVESKFQEAKRHRYCKMIENINKAITERASETETLLMLPVNGSYTKFSRTECVVCDDDSYLSDIVNYFLTVTYKKLKDEYKDIMKKY